MGTVIEWEALVDLGLVAVLMVAWLAARFSISRKDPR
jgi:hypothetical protein